MRAIKEGLSGELVVELVMEGKFTAVVEGDGLARRGGQAGEGAREALLCGLGGFAWPGICEGQPGLALTEREEVVAGMSLQRAQALDSREPPPV